MLPPHPPTRRKKASLAKIKKAAHVLSERSGRGGAAKIGAAAKGAERPKLKVLGREPAASLVAVARTRRLVC